MVPGAVFSNAATAWTVAFDAVGIDVRQLSDWLHCARAVLYANPWD
jgi:hypothetical protein